MGVVKHIGSKSEAEIVAMTSADPLWYDLGFYYPNDTPYVPYFYRVIHGVMQKYADNGAGGSTAGTGILLNGVVLGGVKNVIEADDVLLIPENYEYNVYQQLTIQGQVDCRGEINFIQ